ncbi:hypothetical protein PV350_04855 [Streptomyces sp. PA03-6a]|nr:hypothetical protein [Streptomyces sp. PA03-6a]
MKGTDSTTSQPSTEHRDDVPALPKLPRPGEPTSVQQLLADAAADYTHAQHPDTKLAAHIQGIHARAHAVESAALAVQIRKAG